ncbi:MAG: cache domain-containing protein [Ignavibacteria bacterium]|nr:cache domain-containing protein [Ignavibacteria bacterium]
MKKSIIFIISFIFISIFLILGCKKDTTPTAAYPLNEVLKQIVQNTTTNFSTGLNSLSDSVLTDSAGRALFCQTFLQNARFMDDLSGYVFIESLSGYNIAHPANPAVQGNSSLTQTDANGNLIVEKMIDLVEHSGYGFIKYDYNNPSSGLIEPKTTFINRIPNSNWYAGSGFYFAGNEPYYDEYQKNEKIVEEAVTFMGQGIAAILPVFSNDSLEGVQLMRTFLRNIRYFEDQSGYFFVLDYRGYNVVQPPDPSREGNYQWDLQDSRGNYLMRGLIEKAKQGGGFYSYYWMDYQTNTEKQKNAFVIQIPGYDYLIGSGVYYPNI